MRENSVCAKILCIQVKVIILFLEIEFKFSLHENSVHMSKYTIFRNRVQATQLNFELSSSWERSTQSQLEFRIELSWFLSIQFNSNLMTGLRKTITHKILFNLTIESHKKLIMSMLIADIEHHEAILSKFWMNKNEILLNMKHDTIVFSDQLNISISIFLILLNTKHSSWSRSTLISSATHSNASKILKHSVSIIQKKSFLIQNIDIIFFQALVKWKKKNQIEIFAMFIEDINRKIIYNTQCELNVINIFSVNETTQNLEDIKVKLSSKYQDFLDIFDWAQADKLSSHHSYDHKIKLTSNVTSSHCQAYQISLYKLQKVKKYLNENLFKEFITFSKASYFSSVLFALKANENLWFCVNCQKLNAIIKRNLYSLSLIDEMIDKIVDCKHLTWLNIILTFNKLRMHFDSENYTIFIIALEVYKSKMLFFELINDLISFQQYNNNNKFIHSCDID